MMENAVENLKHSLEVEGKKREKGISTSIVALISTRPALEVDLNQAQAQNVLKWDIQTWPLGVTMRIFTGLCWYSTNKVSYPGPIYQSNLKSRPNPNTISLPIFHKVIWTENLDGLAIPTSQTICKLLVIWWPQFLMVLTHFRLHNWLKKSIIGVWMNVHYLNVKYEFMVFNGCWNSCQSKQHKDKLNLQILHRRI